MTRHSATTGIDGGAFTPRQRAGFAWAVLAALLVGPAPDAWAQRSEERFEFVFQDAALDEVVKLIAAKTGKTFIYDDKIPREKVSIAVPEGDSKMTVDEAYAVFQSILKVKGYTTVPMSDRLVKIVPITDAQGDSIRTVPEDRRGQLTDEFVTRLIRPRYVDAGELETVIKPLLGKRGSAIAVYEATNTLIITDAAANIDRIHDIIRHLDVRGFETQLVVIPIEFASASVLAGSLLEALEEGGGGRATARTSLAARNRRRTTTPGTTPTAVAGESSPIKIIPDERTNSLIVVATQSQIDQIRDLIRKLDYETPQAFGKINVYYLEFANADELATTLANLAGGAAGAARAPAAATPRPGATGAAQTGTAARGGATAALEFEGDVRITSDPATNSLIIVASPQDFLTLRDVIRKLDIRRRQVYVEAVILEASPTSLDQIGFELRGAEGKGREKFVDAGEDGVVGTADDVFEFDLSRVLVGGTGTIPGSLGGSGSFLDGIVESLANPSTATNPLSGIGSGLTLGAILETINVPDPNNPGQFLQLPASVFLLRALRNDTETNIISTPHLLTTDNEEAEIIVGQNVPFITGTNQNNDNFTTSVSREDVGITLRFTPQINESDFVRLTLFVEVSSLVASAVGQDVNEVGPTTSTRTAQSTIIVKDQETIVIGGLIQDQETIQEAKIPYLGDIPILGWLFKFRSSDIRKTNLLLFLTPTIIKDEEDARQVFWEQETAAEKVIKLRPSDIVEKWLRPSDPDAPWRGRPWMAPGGPKDVGETNGGRNGDGPDYIDIPAPSELQ